MKMSLKKLVNLLLLGSLIYFGLLLFNIINEYKSLFYVNTFLPKRPLPVQTRMDGGFESSKPVQEPTILCLITTSPIHHKDRAMHVAATWARHCTSAIFLTSEHDPSLPNSFVIPEASHYSELWLKVSKGFSWLVKNNIMNNYNCQWVIKADDDSFIHIKNLQKALKSYHPDHLLAAGLHLQTWDTNAVYLNGGAGYVLSRAALNHLVEEGIKNQKCKTILSNRGEDVTISECLQHIGVTFLDLKDSRDRKLFHMYSPQEELDPREEITWKHLWLKLKSPKQYKFGFEEMTDRPISFHYVDAETMYLLYYFVYVIQ